MNNNSRKPRNNKRGKSSRSMNERQLNDKNSTKNERRAKEASDAAKEIYMSQSNPYAWYANFPNFAKDVATLPFGTPVGQPIYVNEKDYVANAGIMALTFTPTPGYSLDMTSPINRQAVRIYTYLRSVQRSAANYDSADLMMYLLGIDSLYTYWAYLRRVYGVAQLFTPTNRYYPRRLLQSMGIDADAIVNNLADFRAFINRFALNIGRFAMPKDFDLTRRHMWMCSGLYLDSNTTRAQTYMFTPAVLWKYDNTVETGSQLVGLQFDTFSPTPPQRDMTSLVAVANDMLNNFENDEDTMNISGDLYRAYGAGGCISVEETPDNYAIIPVYDETVLSQIENSVACGKFSKDNSVSFSSPVISQDPSVNSGAIVFAPVMTFGKNNIAGSTWAYNFPAFNNCSMLNMHMDSPNPEQVMEATRLVTHANDSNTVIGADGNRTARYFGSDIVNAYRICTTSLSNPAAVQYLYREGNTIWSLNGTPIDAQDNVDWLALNAQFDWGPMTYLANYTSADNTVNLRLISADVDNFTAVKTSNLANIHEAALLSLLDSPQPINH